MKRGILALFLLLALGACAVPGPVVYQQVPRCVQTQIPVVNAFPAAPAPPGSVPAMMPGPVLCDVAPVPYAVPAYGYAPPMWSMFVYQSGGHHHRR